MLEKILVATDFSEPSRVVYPMAGHAARELGSEIHLVHVVSPLPPLYYEEVWVNVAEEGYYETLSDRLKSEARSEAFEGIEPTPHLLIGEPPARQLADFAETEGMTAIFLGTHGRTGIGHVLIGSFAEKVIRTSAVPVWTVRSALPGRWQPPRSALVPWDFSEAAAAVLPTVRELSDRFGTRFTFLHVFESQIPAVDRLPNQAIIDAFRRIEEEAPLKAQLRFGELRSRELPNVDCRFEWVRGAPHREIVEHAKTEEHDVILIATHGRTGWRHLLLGSVAERVVRHAPCPVITVRPKAEAAAS